MFKINLRQVHLFEDDVLQYFSGCVINFVIDNINRYK